MASCCKQGELGGVFLSCSPVAQLFITIVVQAEDHKIQVLIAQIWSWILAHKLGIKVKTWKIVAVKSGKVKSLKPMAGRHFLKQLVRTTACEQI